MAARRSAALDDNAMKLLETCSSAEIWKLLTVPAFGDLVLEASCYSAGVSSAIACALSNEFPKMSPDNIRRLQDFATSVALHQKRTTAVLA